MILRRPSPGVITSRFGNRVGGFHEGIDFGWGNGWNIYAAASGVVRQAGPGGIYGARYGNLTRIDHGGGSETRYAHQSRMYVRTGQQVTVGDLIGVKGGSGAKGLNTYDPHLHFELLRNGVKVDPMPYFSGTASGTITPIITPEEEGDMPEYIHTTEDGTGYALIDARYTDGVIITSDPAVATHMSWLTRSHKDGAGVKLPRAEFNARCAAAVFLWRAHAPKPVAVGGAAPIDYAALAKAVNDDAARRLAN